MIELQDVTVRFGQLRALARVSLSVAAHQVTGLVGESGSGKSTLLRVMAGLICPSEGQALFRGEPIAPERHRSLAFHRQVQMLLQDAPGSLSPRMTVRRLLAEPARIHGLPQTRDCEPLGEAIQGPPAPPPALDPLFKRLAMTKRTKDQPIHDPILRRLGLGESVLDRYPHQLSGGQARRVAVARALSLNPALLLADEPTAGLDVSVQGELLNLLLEQHQAGLTVLVSSHNLNVIRRISQQTVVMYLAEIVETAPTAALFAAPAHPYTAALLSANPALDPSRRRPRIALSGDIPGILHPPPGCRFHTRCFQVQDRCRTEPPALRPLLDGRTVRCHFPLIAPP